jgi:hypothetical protein
MLVRMRAAGLTLDDVMNVTSGSVPPYRFVYLIEKAKQHASLVQSFGNQVLSALEKRDAEELTRLRTVHEQNLLKLRSQSIQWEITAAADTIESLKRQKAAAEYRRDHFSSLASQVLLPSEILEGALQLGAISLTAASGVLHTLAAVAHLVIDGGAPTAMKWGGTQLGSSFSNFGVMASSGAALQESSARAAGQIASFQRRSEDWKHQIELAKRDVAQIEKQIDAAKIRLDIATESKKVHEKSEEQAREIFDFLRDRFTNLGRFTWLSAELQKLHRIAFNAAFSMARLAEQACQFEHPDEVTGPVLSGNYWDAGNSGLLAGDRLLVDLYDLERRYIETNHRTLEIEQSFSLARFAPDALSRLKTDCRCSFDTPEWFFDLTYPGHYRRRIKAVRLTIPCVVGPHANVGATLRLTESHIRKEPQLDSSVPVPLRHTTVIATSLAQSDAGVFEFAFRDERYMPFEGAGVNSMWQLTLPKAVKVFDYSTISDVILRISYVAQENEDLRKSTEDATAGILATLTATGVTQTWSLRADFPDAWHRLASGAATIDIRDTHLPFFISAFELKDATFDLLTPKPPKGTTYPDVEFDNKALKKTQESGQASDGDASGLHLIGSSSVPGKVVKSHTIELVNSGPLPEDIVLRVSLKRKVT